jgi:hypothetical protein
MRNSLTRFFASRFGIIFTGTVKITESNDEFTLILQKK